jgi:hypothetical protein
MDLSRQQPKMTAGLDIGDRYSYLCLIDRENGEVVEEGRLRTTLEALRRRFASEPSLRIAIETGTHSPWVSRLLMECGHEVLVANARKLSLIYSNKRRPTRWMPRTWPDWRASIRSCFTRLRTGARTPKPTWPSSARGRRWSIAVRNWSTQGTRSAQILRSPLAQMPRKELPQEGQRAHPRGAFAGSRSRLGADRFAHRSAHRSIARRVERDIALDHEGAATSALDKQCLLIEVRYR